MRVLLVLLLLPALAACAGPRPGSLRAAGSIEELTFGGPGFRAVELDGYGLARGPHWPMRAYPPLIAEDLPEEYRLRGPAIAYLGGSRPEVTLVARVPRTWSGVARVWGAGVDTELAGEGVAAAGELRVVAVAARPLPVTVHRRRDWRITWRASQAGREVLLGTSSAQLYTLLAEPCGPLLHTALELAAAGAAGAGTEAKVIDGVWRSFAAREVRRARDAQPLRYYGEYLAGAPAELRRLLVSGTGQCVAWAQLLYASLAAHGIAVELHALLPPERGRLYIAPWEFVPGHRFIEAGQNGVAESEPAGDDVALIPRGRGVPYSRTWAPDPLPIGRLGGDDTLAYLVGRNGIAETFVDTSLAWPLLARGFGLAQQRAYQLEAEAGEIRLGGDDIISTQDGARFVLTGPNGVLETERQPGLRHGRASGSRWEPVVGQGSTSQETQAALPRGWPIIELGGDDRDWRWLVNTGADGVSQTRGARRGEGLPHAVVIAAGANGSIESTPGGDDRLLELADYLRSAPAGYAYVSAYNMWPLPGPGAQHNPWPPTEFPSHVLVRAGGRWYDPSYGTGPFRSVLEWETASLAGVGVRLQRDGNALRVGERVLFAVRRSDGSAQLTRTEPLPPPY